MNHKNLMKIIGKTYMGEDAGSLGVHLSENCRYFSEYANKSFFSANQIIDRFNDISSILNKNNNYSFKLVELNKITNFSEAQKKFAVKKNEVLCEHGLFLYRYKKKKLIGIVIAVINSDGKISGITLSRNRRIFDFEFFGKDEPGDSLYDIPATVHSVIEFDRETGKILKYPDEELYRGKDVYIWNKADEFINKWLKANGFYVYESEALDDCIGYLCEKGDHSFAVYMYAYGREKTTMLDGEYCSRLKKHKYAENKDILIVYLHVKRYVADEVKYEVLSYAGEDCNIELWKLEEIEGKPSLVFYIGENMENALCKLMYAFNHDSLDGYKCVVSSNGLVFEEYDKEKICFDEDAYSALIDLHKKYGNMKYGYVRFNDVIYSKVSYLENYGFFGITVDETGERIEKIYTYDSESRKRTVREFIKTDIREADFCSGYPALIEAEAFPLAESHPFSLKLLFDNGECKKYVPNECGNYEFDEKICHSLKIIDSKESEYENYPPMGQGIYFENGCFLPSILCYDKGIDYSEPVLLNDVVYEDDEIKVSRIWKWKVKALHSDEETGLVKTLIKGEAFNWNGVSTYVTPEGKRLNNMDFDYIDNFHEGAAVVVIGKKGYGYMNESGEMIIPAQYDYAERFRDGMAKVRKNGKWYFVDKAGKELPVSAKNNSDYVKTGEFSEGLCRVSVMDLDYTKLAYHSDYESIAGKWGYIDENGKEIIAPQYIYACDFNDGIAFVCQGEWTLDEKWNNECNSGRYWTEEELWGGIDKTGEEVIPCIFDEIEHLDDSSGLYKVHYDGWKDGFWGIIDKEGNWLTNIDFGYIDNQYKNGMIVFGYEESEEWDELLGVYDINEQKILFEPQFSDVSFTDEGNIMVTVFDEKENRNVSKILTPDGRELFPSVYTSIYTWRNPYEVKIEDENGSRHGLIDKEGNEILPCKYDTSWNGIFYDKKRMVYVCDRKKGLIDFDDNVVVPAIYNDIYGIYDPLLTVCTGEKGECVKGLIKCDGNIVIKPAYENIRWNKNYILCSNEGECEVYKYIEKLKTTC